MPSTTFNSKPLTTNFTRHRRDGKCRTASSHGIVGAVALPCDDAVTRGLTETSNNGNCILPKISLPTLLSQRWHFWFESKFPASARAFLRFCWLQTRHFSARSPFPLFGSESRRGRWWCRACSSPARRTPWSKSSAPRWAWNDGVKIDLHEKLAEMLFNCPITKLRHPQVENLKDHFDK